MLMTDLRVHFSWYPSNPGASKTGIFYPVITGRVADTWRVRVAEKYLISRSPTSPAPI